MMRARAAVLRHPGTPMTIETVDVGPVATGDVLVRIRAAGLCHTDLEARGGRPNSDRSISGNSA
jgi:S-(hydroxymethyl)glutathione dehydrogenase/alcohol dehydrogenase